MKGKAEGGRRKGEGCVAPRCPVFLPPSAFPLNIMSHIIGIGTDITECLRIARMIERHGELFISRVYTPEEIRYCQSRQQATQHFTGRWAAKEAILKALGTGWRRGISWRDMEIRNEPGGKPVVACGAALATWCRSWAWSISW